MMKAQKKGAKEGDGDGEVPDPNAEDVMDK